MKYICICICIWNMSVSELLALGKNETTLRNGGRKLTIQSGWKPFYSFFFFQNLDCFLANNANLIDSISIHELNVLAETCGATGKLKQSQKRYMVSESPCPLFSFLDVYFSVSFVVRGQRPRRRQWPMVTVSKKKVVLSNLVIKC